MGNANSKKNSLKLRRPESINWNLVGENNVQQTVLILGCGDAGKTTLCNKWKFWVLDQTKDKRKSKQLQHDGAVVVLKTLKKSLQRVMRDVILDEVDFKDDIVSDLLQNFHQDVTSLSLPLSKAQLVKLEQLWANETFQQLLFKNFKYTQTYSGLNHYFSDMKRLGKSDYFPSVADLLHSHVKSTGIIKRNFYSIMNKNIQIIEGTGQKVERTKWCKLFRTADVVFFLCSVSEFDECLYEDTNTNRLSDSLRCFTDLVSNPDLYDCTFALIFTKTDLFEQKIESYKSQDLSIIDSFTEEFKPHLNDEMDSKSLLSALEEVFVNAAQGMKMKAFDVNLTSDNCEIFNELENLLDQEAFL